MLRYNSFFIVFLLFFPPTIATPTDRIIVTSFPTIIHNVDDVSGALTNATTAALNEANVILQNYSELLRIIAIPIGLVIAFFGYFLLGPVLFLAAFISAGGASFVAVHAILGTNTPTTAWISIIAMILGGSLVGFLAIRALSLGMFAVGASLGVVLTASFKSTLIAQIYPKDPQLAFYVAATISALILGTIALCLKKQMLIFSTAYAGSFACMFGIGYFTGHFPTSQQIAKVGQTSISPWLILYFILTIALGSLGMAVQFWLAKDKPMPTHAPHHRYRRRRNTSRQYHHDDWSEDDDDWERDETFAERIPLPRNMRSEKHKNDFNSSKFKIDHDQQPKMNQSKIVEVVRRRNDNEELSSTEDADNENPYTSVVIEQNDTRRSISPQIDAVMNRQQT